MVPARHPLILWVGAGLNTCDSADVCENQPYTRRFMYDSGKVAIKRQRNNPVNRNLGFTSLKTQLSVICKVSHLYGLEGGD